MPNKTRKAITKRLRMTRRGKLIHRPPGQDHILAKHTGALKRRLHGKTTLSEREKRAVRRQLYY